jgi:hypothetical protein
MEMTVLNINTTEHDAEQDVLLGFTEVSVETITPPLWKRVLTSDALKIIVFGQVISLLTCGTGVTSQLLFSNYNVAAPTLQLVLNYVMLALVFIPISFRRGSLREAFTKRSVYYLFLAFIDVEANYIIVKVCESWQFEV